MELDGVFMDLYGTLTTGDRQAVESTCEAVIRAAGVPLSARELSIVWGERFLQSLDSCVGDGFETLADLERRTLVETMTELGAEIDPYPFVQMLVDYWRNPPLQREAREFLAAFRPPICVVSNADRADAEIALAVHGIKVAMLVTSEDTRSYKPDPGIFEAALKRTGWRRERVIHVGDSVHSDVGGACAAGIRTAWLNRSHRIHDIGTQEPDYEFADLLEFAAFVNGQP
ncbi:MAG TPA: HAD family hydrolase [Phycisphaerae bacterium]|nr:HAD family hydrolase [Phycisphaerae bacterium]